MLAGRGISGQGHIAAKPGLGNLRIGGFDSNPAAGQGLIGLMGFGIIAAGFGGHVAIADVGADTLITIDSNLTRPKRAATLV